MRETANACALLASVAVVASLGAATAPPASAHGSDPRFESRVTSVKPAITGLTVEVPGGGSDLRLANRTDSDVTVFGYEGEPFARMLANGTVQVNHASPAYWLNMDALGTTSVPTTASKDAAPDWRTEGSSGVLEWHDHRIHWMGTGVPQQVRDRSKRTLVFDWSVPLRAGNRPVQVKGALWWRGQETGMPTAAIVPFAILGLLAAGLAALAIRRRRRRTGRNPARD